MEVINDKRCGFSVPEIVLHLGAHRTATTRLQHILDTNFGVLANANIIALTPPRNGKRNTPTIRLVLNALPTKNKIRFQTLKQIRKARAILCFLIEGHSSGLTVPPRKIIVSDENLLGESFDYRTGAGIYPFAYFRFLYFRRVLRRLPSEIHLTIRPYDSFVVSDYAMRCVYGNNSFPEFDDVRISLLSFTRGWPAVVDDITRVFPNVPIKLTRMEQHPIEDRLAQLVGSSVFSGFRLDGKERLNHRPTIEAMTEARKLRISGSLYDAYVKDSVLEHHANGTRFDPLKSEERIYLRKRYSKDLDILTEKLKKIGLENFSSSSNYEFVDFRCN